MGYVSPIYPLNGMKMTYVRRFPSPTVSTINFSHIFVCAQRYMCGMYGQKKKFGVTFIISSKTRKKNETATTVHKDGLSKARIVAVIRRLGKTNWTNRRYRRKENKEHEDQKQNACYKRVYERAVHHMHTRWFMCWTRMRASRCKKLRAHCCSWPSFVLCSAVVALSSLFT